MSESEGTQAPSVLRGGPTGMRAAGYVRVSTDEQVRDGWNLEEDRARIHELAVREEWELVEIFDDGGRQGDDFERPGLRSMLDSLGNLDVIVMRSIDRLSRDLLIYATVRNAIRKAAVTVYDFDGRPIEFDLGDDVKAVLGEEEKRAIGRRVKQARQARERNGLVAGGHAPFGYVWHDKALVTVADQAAVVRRIFADYANGMGQRAIVRALNGDNVPGPLGGAWQQSRISSILGRVVYTGKLDAAGADGEPIDGKHDAIIDADLWNRVQAIRRARTRADGRGRGGRSPASKHLLTRGMLRCTCSSAMIPRRAREGVERERYVCKGRIEHGEGFCSQPSIRRERIDAPILAALLDRYIDYDATKRRIEDRAASALSAARQVLADAQQELQRSEARLARVRRGWQDDVIDDAEYAEQTAELIAERDGARGAVERAQAHVEKVGEGIVPGDAEQALLDHLARLKRAVGEGVGAAPDLAAMRNVLGDLFEFVQLVRGDDLSPLRSYAGDGLAPLDDLPQTCEGYSLVPVLRSASLDSELEPVLTGIPTPIGQETPVEWSGQYPPGFLARYCWW
jgi:site-specific DNA recombinase